TGASGNITITGDSDVIAIGGSGSPSGGAGIGSGGSTSTTFAPVNNIVIDESTAKVTSTGGTGTSGRHGANIGNGGRSSSEGTSVTPKTSVTLYTIKITAGAGGSIIPPNNIPIVANSNQVIIATADTGYVIDSITIDAVAQTITNKNQVFFVIPAVGADKAVIAAFAPKTVTVTNTQTGTLTYGTAGSATFPVTTTNIDDGIYTATLDGAPSSITADDVTIIGGTGTLTINTLATTGGGVHSMTITLDDATSGKFDLTVSPASQTPLVLVGLGTAYTYGDGPITLSITGGSGGGAVTYTSDNTAVATVSGTTVTINQSGTFNITATKAADSNYSLASVTPGIVTVSEAIPPATLSAAVTSGLDAVLTATVLPVGTGDVPSGTVTFLDGSATLATVPLDASGIAVYTDLSPARGSHSYTAEYNGQTNRYTTNSDTITVAVNPPSTGGSGFGTATIVSPTTPPSVFDNESNNERNNSVPDNGSSSNDFDNANDNSNNNENKNVDQNSGAVTYRLVFVLIVLFLYMLVVAALCFIPKK
ncbi:MAG: Ig-like domain-containing protein, partial [Methanimicrococcus sp.]|nr:Ig-like domain-containing protein [Methanimicrococcus sp.]